MNNFQGFDNRSNGAGVAGWLAGSLAGTGTFLLGIREWWAWGWVPGHWSRSGILHAYWLAFWGHLKPDYEGDLGTWGSFEAGLRAQHLYDAFVASFWVPFLIGAMVGILAGWLAVRAVNRNGAAYLRGGKFN